jgi:DNA-binding transcriptional LysR family regulator
MHIRWERLELLLAVSAAGSLSGAAKRLRTTQPTVSRQLADLEDKLGEPLFVRSVDGTSLTAFGERMLEPAKRMAEAAVDAALVASGTVAAPGGLVRITAPPGLASELLVPFAKRVRKALPDVVLEVLSRVEYLDLARREADLGLRIARSDRPSKQRDLVTLFSVQQGIAAYATREYLARLPRSYGLADLDWIAWAPPFEHLPPTPQLRGLIPGFRPAFTSDDYLVQLRAAEAGVGVIVLGTLRDARAKASPLVKAKVDLGKRTATVDLLAARTSLSIPRVRAVADLLVEEMQSW